MKKRTIREAAIEALKRSGKPIPSNEIYQIIVEHDLYRFYAENPQSIVNGEIRRHCVGIEFLAGASVTLVPFAKFFATLLGYNASDFIFFGTLPNSHNLSKEHTHVNL